MYQPYKRPPMYRRQKIIRPIYNATFPFYLENTIRSIEILRILKKIIDILQNYPKDL